MTASNRSLGNIKSSALVKLLFASLLISVHDLIVIASDANYTLASRSDDIELQHDGQESDAPIPNICMGELGCFPITQDFIHPIYRPINFTPWPRDKVKTKLLLFTHHNRQEAYQMFAWNHKNLALSPFNRSEPVKVIIPGWLDSRVVARWFRQMKDTFLEYGACNVIIVEWDNLIPYLMATMNTRVVGAEVANFINFLVESLGMDAEQFHLIGHSLGAHISGYAGKRVKRLGRISGLDAAQLFFQGMPPTVRLDKTDANFVDIIHSDTNPILPIGLREAVGHVDFYPNGASPQPGCFARDRLFRGLEDGLKDGQVSTIFLQMMRYNTICSHQLSHKWFEKSIMTSRTDMCQFVGVKCNNYNDFINGYCSCDDGPDACAVMGMDAEKLFFSGLSGPSAGDTWFLRASGREPFCLYQYQMVLQLENSKNGYFGKGNLRLTFNYYSEEKQSKEVLQVSLTPPLFKLYPGLRLPYLVTSDEPLGEIYSIYFSWAPADVLGKNVHEHSYPARPVIHLKYIRVTPVAANFGHGRRQLTKFFCTPKDIKTFGIKPLQTVLLDATASCN